MMLVRDSPHPIHNDAVLRMRSRRSRIVWATLTNAVVEHGQKRRVEGLKTTVRLLVPLAYGLHSADPALALVILAAGPIQLRARHRRQEKPPFVRLTRRFARREWF